MTIREQLDAIVEEYNLLNHPFYQAWSAGTLPMEALATYATEYGNFVKLVPGGWRMHGDETIAAEEETHVVLWNKFAAKLGTEIQDATIPEIKSMVSIVENEFSNVPGSMGGLFAFEAQQPHTSTSKLEGLQKHYGSLGQEAEEYFEVHKDDLLEMEILAKRIEALPAHEQKQALVACQKVAVALWDGLTGVHAAHGNAGCETMN